MTFVLEFLAVLLPLTLSPGPATVALASQGMASGIGRSLQFYLGLLISTLIITIICSLGFSSLILANDVVFRAFQYAGVAYIFYLGTKLIRAKPSSDTSLSHEYTFVDGFTLSFLNPKLFVMIMALFSQFVSTSADLKYVILLFIIVIAFSQAVWLSLGVFLNTVLKSSRLLAHMTTVFGVALIAMSIYLLMGI